jgi:hypothetical protein
MIRLADLHLQLMQDPFYGFPGIPLVPGGSTNPRQPPITHTALVVERMYSVRTHDRRASSLKARYADRRFNHDKHRELITQWCALFGLPLYQGDTVIERSWQALVDQGLDGLCAKKDDLQALLRDQQLPLPAYFFPDEPDNTDNPETVDRVIAVLTCDGEEALAPSELRQRAQGVRNQRWQARIDELAAMAEHQTKTHADLCTIVAGELIAQGNTVATIMRTTRSPYKKNSPSS